MDYNYIKQLLQRYWSCQTSLEEEEILRAFFSQKTVPAELAQYQPLFAYQAAEAKADTLGDDFDRRVLALTQQPTRVHARIIPMAQRLKPLFKAAAVVAIMLTISNAFQMSFDTNSPALGGVSGYDYDRVQHGTSVAKADSAVLDTMSQTSIQPTEVASSPIIK